MHTSCAILILAAGSSSRLGEPKQLVRYQEESLLRQSVSKALRLSAHVFGLLGHAYEACLEEINDLNVSVIYHESYAQGIGSSIAVGISHTTAFSQTLIMLCDQPLIPLSHYQTLLSQASSSHIVASQYLPSSRLGVPAVFPKRYYDALCLLRGDKGAQMLLSQEPTHRVALDAALSVDIDTQEDIIKHLRFV